MTLISSIAAGALLMSACSSDSNSSGELSQELKDQYVQSELAVTAVEDTVLAAATAQPADFATIVDDWDTLNADITAYEQTLDDLIAAALEADNDPCKDALLQYRVLELADSEHLSAMYEAASNQDSELVLAHATGLNTLMNSAIAQQIDGELESKCGLTL